MPTNPIFGGPIGGWGAYNRQRTAPLNNNPNLSQAEYNARLASLGNPTSQSYGDYTASDDYAAGWRPAVARGATPPPASNYVVPTQLGGAPNIIPVGANITDGTTTTTNNPTPTTPPPTTQPPWGSGGFGGLGDILGQLFGGGGFGGFGMPIGWTPDQTGGSGETPAPTPGTGGGSGAGYGGNYSPYLPTNNGYVGNPNNMSYSGGGYPQTGIQQSTRNPNNMSYNPTPGVQYPQTLGQTPTQNANPTVAQEWSNRRGGNGNGNGNRRRNR